MRWAGGLAAGLAIAMTPMAAMAGAWPQTPGATQVILSYEPGRADSAFDGNGSGGVSLGDWQGDTASVYAEHGLGRRFTITGKINFRDDRAAAGTFSGFSSAEIGARWTVRRRDSGVLAIGASVEGLGKGRRNDFDSSLARQGTDGEIRAYAGKSFRLAGMEGFADIQAARRWRQYDAHQLRFDATLGLKPTRRWMVLAQVFAGQTDQASWGRADWANGQLSVVRNFGPGNDLSLQLGVRQTLTGRNVPKVSAVVVSLWKAF